MGKRFNMIGMVINGMEILSESDLPNYKYLLEMRCHCGEICHFKKDYVKAGKCKSCGCKNKKVGKKKKHGETRTKLYARRNMMIMRCYNEKNKEYKNYGGRGIKICDEWLGEGGYENFKKWSLDNGYKDDGSLSLDRIDVNGDYCPDNCRYTDAKTQSRNRRKNWYEYYKGEKRLVIDICEEIGINYNTIATRKYNGYSGDLLFVKRIKKSQFI